MTEAVDDHDDVVDLIIGAVDDVLLNVDFGMTPKIGDIARVGFVAVGSYFDTVMM